MKYMMIGMLISVLLYAIVSGIGVAMKRIYQKLFVSVNGKIFNQYIDPKQLFIQLFRKVPSSTYIGDVDMSKAYEHMINNYGHLVRDQYQSCSFNRKADQDEFDETIFVLANGTLVELSYQSVTVLYPGKQYGFAKALIRAMNEYRIPEKVEDYEINIITYSGQQLTLKRLDIKPMNLDISMYYNDDFMAVSELLKNRLNQLNDKGIVLLHGLPGTGKTTYLRHLIGNLNKRVLFVSPSAAENLMSPMFVDLLIDNPNSILVIEDAENIMMDRKFNHDSSVSNLLNLSDGLLSDCLSVQIICTFNSKIDLIDSALMRKGRLITRYEFGKLSIEKAQKLSSHLGFETIVRQPMTIAEIANQHEIEAKPKTEAIGFMRSEVQMN